MLVKYSAPGISDTTKMHFFTQFIFLRARYIRKPQKEKLIEAEIFWQEVG